ncbi:TrmB family transcriptional regulator sugar-binding domain-containing protein [Halapricum hydrolyticum]|uniref:Transcription regulator TrmB C-terminal domain-containing protein n=1 Tax=Halapricum hydrolyticum TaxID=2979991 RepID=A0AAE3LFK7_9EURY|nr:TrmB family transcriptional regulator sugar-binding domain-containing protein [Halapricum hydrolyticum]MCU4718561.1 hypothetical protein [Halapricum hydrolyticum]MCU4727590.1 hypothetical protein [Halapricum hydrolyticum]
MKTLPPVQRLCLSSCPLPRPPPVLDEPVDLYHVRGSQFTVVDVRQSLIEPRDSSFGFENTLFVEFEEGVRTVGGEDAFLEDYEAARVTLMRDDG